MIWSYLTSFHNVGPLIVWAYIIAIVITLIHFTIDRRR